MKYDYKFIYHKFSRSERFIYSDKFLNIRRIFSNKYLSSDILIITEISPTVSESI